jgi:hypothetical protein
MLQQEGPGLQSRDRMSAAFPIFSVASCSCTNFQRYIIISFSDVFLQKLDCTLCPVSTSIPWREGRNGLIIVWEELETETSTVVNSVLHHVSQTILWCSCIKLMERSAVVLFHRAVIFNQFIRFKTGMGNVINSAK